MMRNIFDQLLRLFGGRYIIIATATSQLLGLIGMIPGMVFLYLTSQLVNINFSITTLVFSFVGISQVILLVIAWWVTPVSRAMVDEWRSNSKSHNPSDELSAWREITNLTTVYGISILIVYILLVVAPPFFIAVSQRGELSSAFQSTSITSPTPLYILLGGLASIFGAIVLTLLLLERVTLPVRLVLIPKDYNNQLKGRSGVLLGIKFQALTLGLIIVSVAIIAPLGYQQTLRILYSEVNSIQVFIDLQNWSLLLSSMIIVLGLIYSYFATRAITSPVNELIQTVQRIEQGDLSQRVPVTATDELATVAIQFNRMVSRLNDLQSTLEEQVKTRTKLLTATNEVGRVASSILDPEELLQKITELITEQFSYYYSAIYVLDESKKWAELKEATGQTGSILKQNRHRVDASGRTMIAQAIREKSPRISQNTTEEKSRMENPLLPYTRSEVALPLVVGDRVIGALNVHSTKENDFDLGVIETLQNLSGQISIALENARLFQEAQKSIQELRAIQKQYLEAGWRSSAFTEDDLEYSIGDPSDSTNQSIQSAINLREQVLGEIRLEANQEWTPEQQSLVDAVAVQAAIALENARLVSESRQIAARERTLAEINSKIWSSPSLDTILQTVARELGKRLNASNVVVELNSDDE